MNESTKSRHAALCMRLGSEGFVFLSGDPSGNGTQTVLEPKTAPALSLTANLKKAFEEQEMLNADYKQVRIVFADKRFTLVPAELFDESQQDVLFYYNHPRHAAETLCHHTVDCLNTVVVFAADSSTLHFLNRQFPQARCFSQAGVLLQHFAAASSRAEHERTMYVHASRESIGVYAFHRNRLLLANVFHCRYPEDRVYYLLYVWKQLEFDQLHDGLCLTGDITGKEKFVTQLREFVRHISIPAQPAHIDLQTLLTCE